MSVYQTQRSRVFSLFKYSALILSFSVGSTACDDDSPKNSNNEEMTAGEVQAGEVQAGEAQAGEVQAGEVQAGEIQAGEVQAGEMQAGEMQAGEVQAGEIQAGEIQAGEVQAGEMMFDGSYSPEAPMSSLSDEGQQAFCESFVMRNQAADAMTSERDREAFKEKSCLLAGLFGGATNETECEAARMQCIMDFENAMFTVESCMNDFASAFMTCNATVGEIEACEVATRSQLLSAILSTNTSLFSCANVGDPCDIPFSGRFTHRSAC